MDERRTTLLRELERALLEALSESADVHRALERMHDEGFVLQMFLDCHREGEPERDLPSDQALVPELPAGTRSAGFADLPPGGDAARAARAEPLFRINSEDLAMLRALGIDPTRKGRGRR